MKSLKTKYSALNKLYQLVLVIAFILFLLPQVLYAQGNNNAKSKSNSPSDPGIENTEDTSGLISDESQDSAIHKSQTQHTEVDGVISDLKEKEKRLEKVFDYLEFLINTYIKILKKSAPGLFSPILLILIVYLFLNLIILLIVMIINRTNRERAERKKKALKEKYQTFIFDYVFDEEKMTPIPQSLRDIKSNYKRKVLLEEILHLEANFKGRADVKLRELYIKLRLYKNSLKKVRNRAWFIKAHGFRELSRMRMNRYSPEIKKYLNNKNPIIRNEAHLALVQMDDKTPFKFLDNFNEQLTIWEQMNIYHLVNYHYLEIPDFKNWLKHKNPSVVGFALKMIGVFEQMHAYNNLIKMLDHPDKKIRGNVIVTLGAIGLVEALPHLKERLEQETPKNKLRIIKAMQKIPHDDNLEFFEKYLHIENYEFRMEVIKAIFLLGDKGKNRLTELYNDGDPEFRPFIDHVLDARINV